MQQVASNAKQSSSKSGLLYVALLFFVGAIALTLVLVFPDLPDRIGLFSRASAFVYAGLSLALGIAVLAAGFRGKDSSILEIVYLSTLLYLLHFPVRAFFLLLWPGETRVFFGWPVNSDSYVAFALAVALLGQVFFYLGYFWGVSAKLLNFLPKVPWAWTDYRLLAKTLFLFGLGAMSFLARFATGSSLRFQWYEERSTSFLYSMLALFDVLIIVSVYLIWVVYAREKRNKGVVLLFALTLSAFGVAMGSVSGNKQFVFSVLLAIILAIYYAGARSLSFRRLVLFTIVGLIFLGLLFPFIQTYRDVYNDILGYRPDPRISDILDLSGGVISSVSTGGNGGYLKDTVVAVMNRAVNLDALTMVVYRIPNTIDFGRGETLWPTIISGFIPRMIWGSKPVLNLGAYMNNVIVGSISRSNLPITDVGEFYYNFGVIGVPLGMLLFGIFYRAVYSYVHRLSDSYLLQGMLYLAILPTLLFSGTGVAVLPVALVRIAVVQVAVVWFITRGPVVDHTQT